LKGKKKRFFGYLWLKGALAYPEKKKRKRKGEDHKGRKGEKKKGRIPL